MSLAKKIRSAREALDFQQVDLAKRLKVAQSTVSDWESGVQLPRPANLRKVAKVLRLDYAELRNDLIAEKFA